MININSILPVCFAVYCYTVAIRNILNYEVQQFVFCIFQCNVDVKWDNILILAFYLYDFDM
jgi:hypothetical protein